MKRRRHRLVLDVTFLRARTEKEAQNSFAQLATQLTHDRCFVLSQVTVKEFSRVLRAEQRKALLGSQQRQARQAR